MDSNYIPTLLVLAGGFGTRLQTVVTDVPKPLAPVSGKPFLFHQINNWYAQGARDIVLLLHYKSELVTDFIFKHQRAGNWPGCDITCLTEEKPLGTGGAIAFAVKELALQKAFIVVNADTWLGTGLKEICEVGFPAISVVGVNDAGRYGLVRTKDGMVKQFDEKSSAGEPGTINAGIYFLGPKIFQDWQGQTYSIEEKIFPDMASKGILHCAYLDTDFLDIGIPSDYLRFCSWIKEKRGFSL